MLKNLRPFLGLAVLALIAGIAGAPTTRAAAEPAIYTFDGYDLKSGQLMFRGETRIVTEGNRQKESVRYLDLAGTVIQTLESEFDAGSSKLYSLRREFPLTGEMESAVIENDRVILTHRESGNAKEKQEKLKWNGAMSFPPTVVPRMQLAWDPLKNGKTIEVEMVVPSRLDSYGFRLVKDGEPEIEGKRYVVIRLEPGSVLVRRLVDPMYFVWTEDGTRRIVEYRGRTTVRDAKGDQVDARIVYHYPGQ